MAISLKPVSSCLRRPTPDAGRGQHLADEKLRHGLRLLVLGLLGDEELHPHVVAEVGFQVVRVNPPTLRHVLRGVTDGIAVLHDVLARGDVDLSVHEGSQEVAFAELQDVNGAADLFDGRLIQLPDHCMSDF